MTYSLKLYRMLISLDIDKKEVCKCYIFIEETDGGLLFAEMRSEEQQQILKGGLC